MSDSRLIRLTIEGLTSDDGHVRLAEFTRQLEALQRLLRSGEKLITGVVESDYRVVELSHSSPATVVVEQIPIKPKLSPPAVMPRIIGAIDEIASDMVPDANRGLLTPLRAMSSPVGLRLRSSTLSSNGSSASLTPRLAAQINRLLEPEMTEFGEVQGRLEQINFHASANKFIVYSSVGPDKVACRFPSRLVAEAERSVNKEVVVEGELHFRSSDNFPYLVDVQGINTLNEGAIVRLMDLRGKAPRATGKKSSQAFVWSLRDEW